MLMSTSGRALSMNGMQFSTKHPCGTSRRVPKYTLSHASCCRTERAHHTLAHTALLWAAGTLLALKAQAISSPESFTKNCAGCHAGGGNIVARGATLKLADLQKNGAATPEAIYELIYKGKGKMPGYGINCAPKGKCTFAARIPDDEIQQLTEYVLDHAAKDWR